MRAVNLIPGEQRSGGSVGAGRSGGAAYAVLALLLGFAVLAVAYGKASRTVSKDESKASSLSAQAARDKAAAERLAPYTSFVALRKAREEAVTSLVDQRFDWAHAMHELGRVLTAQVSITSLSGQVGNAEAPTASTSSSSSAKTASVSSATPAGAVPSFQLSGCARSQKAVAQMLQRLRLIDGVAEVTLQSSTRGSSGGAGATGGGCPPNAPVFSVSVAYEPLPAPSEAAAAAQNKTKTVSDTNSTVTPSPAPTKSGGGVG
jgi:Tfp pilus assembly protein PilN